MFKVKLNPPHNSYFDELTGLQLSGSQESREIDETILDCEEIKKAVDKGILTVTSGDLLSDEVDERRSRGYTAEGNSIVVNPPNVNSIPVILKYTAQSINAGGAGKGSIKIDATDLASFYVDDGQPMGQDLADNSEYGGLTLPSIEDSRGKTVTMEFSSAPTEYLLNLVVSWK